MPKYLDTCDVKFSEGMRTMLSRWRLASLTMIECISGSISFRCEVSMRGTVVPALEAKPRDAGRDAVEADQVHNRERNQNTLLVARANGSTKERTCCGEAAEN